MKKLLALLFLSLVGYAGFAQAPTSVYWLKSRVDGSVPTPISGWGSLYFDYVTAKWKICNGTSCYDLPIGTTTRNNLPPSTHTSSFTLAPADTSKMHILSGGSGAIVITMGTFSGLSGKGLQFAFRRDRTDTVYFDDGSETIIQSPGATLGIADSTFAYLYYNGTTDKFYLANGGSGGGSSGSGGSGTVTDVSVVTANGVSGSVATSTTTPAITISLGAITPTSVNSVVVSGSSTPTLAVTGTTTVSGANTGDQTTVTGNAGTATALATSRTIGTLTGDATSAGSGFNGTANNTNAITLATVNSNVGSFGSATLAPVLTVNGKGLITAASTATITPAVGSITGLGTGIATALAINTGSAGAPVLLNAAGGTPSSLTGTNITGTASGLTAGNVTTNANLTGPVTSTGNATAIASSIALPGSPTTTTQALGTNNTTISTTAYADRIASLKASYGFKTVNTKTASYTAVAADTSGVLTLMNVATANNFTIPTFASVPFRVGAILHLMRIGAGTTSIIGPGVTLTYEAGISGDVGLSGPMDVINTGTDAWRVCNGTPPLVTGDITRTNGTFVTTTLTGSTTDIILGGDLNIATDVTSTLTPAFGGLGFNTNSTGDIVIGTATNTFGKLADVAVGSYLRSGGVTTAPLWSTLILPNAATSGRVVFASATNTYGEDADMTFATDKLTVTKIDVGTLTLPTAGNGVLIKEGSNATMGVATLVAGTVTVSTTKVTANSRIFLTGQNLGTITVPVGYAVSARSAGTSFTILSANVVDTSSVAWMIVEPAP